MKNITAKDFLKAKGCIGTELLAHSITGAVQTSEEWASEFVSNNPENETESCWAWDDFDTLEDVTDKVSRGDAYINDRGILCFN